MSNSNCQSHIIVQLFYIRIIHIPNLAIRIFWYSIYAKLIWFNWYPFSHLYTLINSILKIYIAFLTHSFNFKKSIPISSPNLTIQMLLYPNDPIHSLIHFFIQFQFPNNSLLLHNTTHCARANRFRFLHSSHIHFLLNLSLPYCK